MAWEGKRDMSTPWNLGNQELSENQGKTFWGLKDEKVDSRWQCGERHFQQRKQRIRMWLKKTEEFGKQ